MRRSSKSFSWVKRAVWAPSIVRKGDWYYLFFGANDIQNDRQLADDVLRIEEGSLYPAPHRLETRGWIAAEWGTSENNRRAKFYTLTSKGRAQLRVEAANWTRFAHAVFAVLEAPPEPAS